MYARILMFLLMLVPCIAPLEAGLVDKIQNMFTKEPLPTPPSVKILLVNDQESIILEVKGRYRIYDPRTGQHIVSRLVGKRRLLQGTHDGIRWGEEFPGIHQLAIVPSDPNTTTIVDGVEYKGEIYVYDIGGTISVVNHLDIEDYLYTLLAPYAGENLPQELWNALAITYRSFAYYQAEHSKTPYWDVDAQKVGYNGFASTKRPKPMETAINETHYMILSQTGKDGWLVTPFQALWRPLKGGPLPVKDAVYSVLTVEEGVELAKRGKNASDILQKAFPKSTIELMHYTTDSTTAENN